MIALRKFVKVGGIFFPLTVRGEKARKVRPIQAKKKLKELWKIKESEEYVFMYNMYMYNM